MNIVIRSYAVFVCLWFLANYFVQDIWWPLVVLDKFAKYFLYVSPLVLLVALFTKKSVTVFAAILAVLVTGYFYTPLLMPAKSQSAASTHHLRIATYNIWNHNDDLKAVVGLIEDTQADVIAVQEITDVQQAELTARMSRIYPYFRISTQVYGGTTALFSKLPLNKVQELDFGTDRPAVLADIVYEDVVITVVSAHLNPSFWAYHDKPLLEIPGNYHQYIKDQNTQARMIIEAIMERTNSTAAVLACDCNSQETASTNRFLGKYLNEAYRTMGFQFGQPNDAALKYERNLSHIDYIWFSGNVSLIGVYRAKQTAGSDHAPVLADFSLR